MQSQVLEVGCHCARKCGDGLEEAELWVTMQQHSIEKREENTHTIPGGMSTILRSKREKEEKEINKNCTNLHYNNNPNYLNISVNIVNVIKTA